MPCKDYGDCASYTIHDGTIQWRHYQELGNDQLWESCVNVCLYYERYDIYYYHDEAGVFETCDPNGERTFFSDKFLIFLNDTLIQQNEKRFVLVCL